MVHDYFFSGGSPPSKLCIPHLQQIVSQNIEILYFYDTIHKELARHITLVEQDQPLGFGHAVYCARKYVTYNAIIYVLIYFFRFVGNKPFVVFLGDHVYTPARNEERTCGSKLVEAFKLANKSITSVGVSNCLLFHNTTLISSDMQRK